MSFPEDFTQIDGEQHSLIAPYNPARCMELISAAFPPPAVPSEVGPEDWQLSVYLPNPVSPEDYAAAVATLTALGSDPTRNDLTEEEQERAAIQNKLDNAVADIAALTDPGWIALTNAQKIDALHDVTLHNTRSIRYLLREKKKDLTGVFSLTS